MSQSNSDWVLYEHPLNERLRTLMRLEFLTETASTAMAREAAMDSRTAVEALIYTLNILERGEVRSEVIKELDRLSGGLARMGESGQWAADDVREETERCRALLRRVGEPDAAMGQALREDQLLAAIAQRFGLGAGTCNFDLPSFQRWLSRPYSERRADLQRWLDSMADLRATLQFALRLQREGGQFQEETASGGSWQRRIPFDNPPIQMLRLQVPAEDSVIPEISGNRHFVTIRFLRQPDTLTRPESVNEDVPFHLARCDL